MQRNGLFVAVAFFCAGAYALALAMEIIRTYQEITRLNDRYNAFMRGQIAEYDATWTSGCLYIPGTDVPLHPAAVAFTPWWRIITCIVLLFFFLTNIPSWKYPTYAWGPFCIIFNRDVSPWYQGFLEFYIGLSFLGTLVVFPAGPDVGVDDDTLTWCRYVSGWLLLGCGFFNILLGVTLGPRVRVLKGQSFPHFLAPQAAPGARIKMVWPQIRTSLMTAVGGNAAAMGPMAMYLHEMDHAVSLV